MSERLRNIGLTLMAKNSKLLTNADTGNWTPARRSEAIGQSAERHSGMQFELAVESNVQVFRCATQQGMACDLLFWTD